MKIAIFSDIHSNLEALTTCYNFARKNGVEKYICLGDIIGYGADPVPVLDMIMSLPGLIAVKGNHDQAAQTGQYPDVDKDIQESVRWTHEQLSSDHKEFINNLKYVELYNNIAFSHASAHEPEKWEYIYDAPQIVKCMNASEQQLTFLGHTHLPKIYYENTKGLIQEVEPREKYPVHIYQRRRYVINVGSVGQPRDKNSGASFVIYDFNKADITFHRIAYDFKKTAKKIISANLPPYFAERLNRNK